MPASAKKRANLLHEHQFMATGYRLIVGVDEAGRGAWAGPVAAGAVCLPLDNPDLSKLLRGVNDSKQLTSHQRSVLIEKIKAVAYAWGVGSASNDEIDTLGIVPSTLLAMRRAVEAAIETTPDFQPDVLFIDAILIPDLLRIPQVSLIGGDARSLSIAAASIVAKVWRDALMDSLDQQYPMYHFASNKGYGGAEQSPHAQALLEFGPSPLHRKTFAPVANAIKRRQQRQADE